MNRVFHTWEKWECYPAGFYEAHPPKEMTVQECEVAYRDFLKDDDLFASVLLKIITTWTNSCEHYLTNDKMNRIAWLGQAAVCLHLGIPSRFRGGYNLLSEDEKTKADETALEYLNKWRFIYMAAPLSMGEVQSRTKANIY